MTTHAQGAVNPVVEALTATLKADPTAYSGQPSQLRLRLMRRLGDDATIHRRDLHLVVTALDENVPAELLAAAPLTTDDVRRHALLLASARGWTEQAASSAVDVWVSALGLDVTSGTGPAHRSSEASDPTAALVAGSAASSEATNLGPEVLATALPEPASPSDQVPQMGSLSRSDPAPGSLERSTPERSTPERSVPGRSADPATDLSRTNSGGPDDASTVLPARRLDPLATELPDASSLVAGASALSPNPAAAGPATPQPDSAQDSTSQGTAAVLPWPASSKMAIGQAAPREGFPIGAYFATRGKNPRLRWVLLAVFTVLVTPALLLLPTGMARSLIVIVLIGSMSFIPLKLVRSGILIVDEDGFRWYAALPKSGPAEITSSWSNARVIPGSPPRLAAEGAGEIWLNDRKGGLVAAIRSRTPGGTP